MKQYHGTRETGTPVVWIEDGRVLKMLRHQKLHSPTGIEWGYGGSGPADLALSLLMDALNDRRRAKALHQAFKWDIVAGLPHEEWTLTMDEIQQWAQQHEDETQKAE